jgi:hypothetical protein
VILAAARPLGPSVLDSRKRFDLELGGALDVVVDFDRSVESRKVVLDSGDPGCTK